MITWYRITGNARMNPARKDTLMLMPRSSVTSVNTNWPTAPVCKSRAGRTRISIIWRKKAKDTALPTIRATTEMNTRRLSSLRCWRMVSSC